MKKTHPDRFICSLEIVVFFLSAGFVFSQVDRFKVREGRAIEVWRLTDDPTVRDWANYHNIQCWSPDGRYVCFTRFASNGVEFGTSEAAEIHIYDLFEKKDITVDNGTSPRWANDHNWLFYVRTNPEAGPLEGKGLKVMWLDVDENQKRQIASGMQILNEPDHDDRWLTGMQYLGDNEKKAVRIPIEENPRVEDLQGLGKYIHGHKWNVNPSFPIMSYWDARYKNFYYATHGTRDIPFNARHRVMCDLEGGNRTAPFPIMEGAHFGWSGDGRYLLCGNGQVRGVRHDESLPANIHFLAGIRVGDICRCGLSGRWICGSTESGRGPLQLADTRSGDGWMVLRTHSVISYPGSGDHSGPYDIDAKGSPDGTKITFITNYDLKNGPYAEITEDVTGDRILVRSTDGFPENGRLVSVSHTRGGTGFHTEVLSYGRKTATSFESLTRGLYGTTVSSPVEGQTVTSFETRLIPRDKWQELPLPSTSLRNIIKDENSPLRKQRSSDIYVAVVRLPDQPYLREIDDHAELIPGENHWEIYGYSIYRNGKKESSHPVRPGAFFPINGPGRYTAVAVEWSGLESKKSHPLQLTGATTLRVRRDKPSDFSWTVDRWLVAGKEVSPKDAKRANEAVREIVHRYDGVIHREWYNWGQVLKSHDLNLAGKPTRHLYYQNGGLARREYYKPDGSHVSTEYCAPDGYITESVQFKTVDGESREVSRWWYEKAVPVRNISRGTVFEKDGSRWVRR